MTTLEAADFYACWKLLDLKNSNGPKSPRFKRCGKCIECRRPNCGYCRECLDKKEHGGKSIRKRSCVNRECLKRVDIGKWTITQLGPLIMEISKNN
jgi:hypothetical protein